MTGEDESVEASRATAGPPIARDTISRNAVFALALRLMSALFTAALTVYLARALGAKGYGLFALALAVGGLLTLPSDLGISASAERFIAEHRADHRMIVGVMADALKLKLPIAGAISIGLFAGADLIASAYHDPGLVWPLRGIALALFGQSLMSFFEGAFVALGRISNNFNMIISESVVETGASIALVALGTGVTGAAFGRGIGYMFGAAVGLLMTVRYLGRFVVSARVFRGGEMVRRVAVYAATIAVVDWAWSFFVQMDALVIGAILGAEAVGVFRAPVRFLLFLQLPGLALAAAVAPRLARHDGETQDIGAFTIAFRYLLILQAAWLAPLVVWPRPIIDLLLGSGYEGAVGVLRAIAPYVFLSGVAPLVSLTANFLGEARLRLPIVLGTLGINLAIDLILIPRIGIVAAAIGSSAAFALYVPAHIWVCRRKVALPLRPIFVTTGRSLLAAVAMAGVLFAVGTSDLSLGEWALGIAGGTAVFLAVLLVSGELSSADLEIARPTALRRRLMRAP